MFFLTFFVSGILHFGLEGDDIMVLMFGGFQVKRVEAKDKSRGTCSQDVDQGHGVRIYCFWV